MFSKFHFNGFNFAFCVAHDDLEGRQPGFDRVRSELKFLNSFFGQKLQLLRFLFETLPKTRCCFHTIVQQQRLTLARSPCFFSALYASTTTRSSTMQLVRDFAFFASIFYAEVYGEKRQNCVLFLYTHFLCFETTFKLRLDCFDFGFHIRCCPFRFFVCSLHVALKLLEKFKF